MKKLFQFVFIFTSLSLYADTQETKKMLHLGFVGDTMLNASTNSNPIFLDTQLKNILLQNDGNFINLEGTIKNEDETGPKKCSQSNKNCFLFSMPTKFIPFLKEWNVLGANMANNHSFDYGASIQKNTINYLDSNNILPFGTPNLPYQIISINGQKIGLIGISPHTHTNRSNDVEKIKLEIKELKTQVDVIVAMVHMGAEGSNHNIVDKKTEIYIGENRGNVYEFSHMLIDNGVNLVVGSGPHVLRGIEQYQDGVIAYSLGNFLTYKGFFLGENCKYGGLLNVSFQGKKISSLSFVGTEQGKKDGQTFISLSQKAERFLLETSNQNFKETSVFREPFNNLL